MAQQPAAVLNSLLQLSLTIYASIAGPSDDLLVFEHGAAKVGSPIGCGVDYAHLHILVAPTVLLDSVWSELEVELAGCESALPLEIMYERVDPEEGYYVAWRKGRRLLEQPAWDQTSQRLRRTIAAAVGTPHKWDYKQYPFTENISKTVSTFQRVVAV